MNRCLLNGPIEVAMCTDEHGADFMQVAIKSLFVNGVDDDIKLHVVTGGLSEETIRDIRQLAVWFNREIEIHTVDTGRYGDLPLCLMQKTPIPRSMYLRFSLPDILPDCRKMIYLDTDVIVCGSIRELWETEIGESFVAATAENGIDRRLVGLGLDEEMPHINSGVMIMNLDAWRKERLSERAIKWIRENSSAVVCPDQDAISIVCQGRVMLLPPKFNVTTLVARGNFSSPLVEEADIEEARRDPVIVHYTGLKPWLRYFPPRHVPKRAIFKRYRKMKPATTLRHRRRVVWTRDWVSYLIYRLKSNRLTGRLYRLCPGFWRALKNLFCFQPSH